MMSIATHLAQSPAASAQRLVRGLAYMLAGPAFVLSALLGAGPAMAVAPTTHRVAACSWDHPGVNPYMGEMAAAVDRYTDIPPEVRARLQQRMAKRQYDEIAVIKRDSIEGESTYDPTLRDMHFGTDRVCTDVSREAWSAAQQERGLVYCEGNQCLIVPTVCRNVSRITRKSNAVTRGPLDDELLFAPPGAGPAAPAAPMPEGGPTGNAAFTGGEPDAMGSSIGNPWLSSPSFASLADSGAGGGVGAPEAAGAGSTDLSPTTAAPSFGDNPGIPAAGVNVTPIAGTPIFEQIPGVNSPAVLAVPEPGTWALMLAGLIGCAMRGRAAIKAHVSPV